MNADLFDWKRVFIPVSTQRTRLTHGVTTYTGVLVVRIFGLRVAQFQLTNPW